MPLEELEIQSLQDVVLARLHGEVDLSNAVTVKQRLLDAVPNRVAALILDLSGTQYLDSSGVHLIFELAERMRSRGQRLALVVPEDSSVKHVLVLTEVEQAASMFASVESALQD